MKICLFTILNDDFIIAFKGFIKSFLYNNPWFDYDFVILDLNLSDESKETIKSYYDKVVFRKPNYDDYKGVNFDKTHDRLKATYYTLDAFSLYEYDRVVALDMDMVVLGGIAELFTCGEDFAACKAYNERQDILVDSINSGVFVVNKKYLNPESYHGLLKIASRGYSMPDQKTINIFFRNKISYFNKSFNVEKRMIRTVKYKKLLNKIRILHYVGAKPWDEDKPPNEMNYKEFEDIWWEWYNKC